jgi:acyl-CoA thioesterase-2
MPTLKELIGILDLEVLERDLFRGRQDKRARGRIFGGQVVAQSMAAAYRTVERPFHSLHGYFIRAGDPGMPVVFQVDRLRDGGSFSVRRVLAIQHGEAIFSMGCSFQTAEKGLEHQRPMPDVPGPDGLPSVEELLRSHEQALPLAMQRLSEFRPFEFRPVETAGFLGNRVDERGERHVWFRSKGPIPDDDPALQNCILGYVSDMALLEVIFHQHGRSLFHRDMIAASLDHALWIHRPFRAEEWTLYQQDSPSTSGGRGLARGTFFSRDGRLIASVAQEGLIRIRRPPPASA